MANRIYGDLLNIRYKVKALMAMAQYATMNDFFFAIDPEGWASAVNMQSCVIGLIAGWRGSIHARP